MSTHFGARAEMLCKLVRGGGALRLESLQCTEARKVRPLCLNTVEMLKLASRGLGIGNPRPMMLRPVSPFVGCT